MADVIRDVVIRIALQQVETKLKPPEIAPTAKAVETINKKIEETSIAFRMGQKASVDFAGSLRKHYEEAAARAEGFRVKSQAEMLKVGESMSRAGQGAFTLARGIAFMGTSSDEDFQRMIQTVAKVQGGFDLFRGSIETIKGIRRR